jgi:hypothetical protein
MDLRTKCIERFIPCLGCRAKVIEVVQLKLPDADGTPVHAIRFRKLERLRIEIDAVLDDAPPGDVERAKAIVKAMGDRKPSYRLGAWDWTPVLDGPSQRVPTLIASGCRCKSRSAEWTLPVDKILSGEITSVDPRDPDDRDDTP